MQEGQRSWPDSMRVIFSINGTAVWQQLQVWDFLRFFVLRVQMLSVEGDCCVCVWQLQLIFLINLRHSESMSNCFSIKADIIQQHP